MYCDICGKSIEQCDKEALQRLRKFLREQKRK